MKSPPPRLVRNSACVIRITRSFEPMHNNNHRKLPSLPFLPVTHTFQLCLRIHTKQSLFPCWQGKGPRRKGRPNGLRMPAPQPPIRLKFSNLSPHHISTLSGPFNTSPFVPPEELLVITDVLADTTRPSAPSENFCTSRSAEFSGVSGGIPSTPKPGAPILGNPIPGLSLEGSRRWRCRAFMRQHFRTFPPCLLVPIGRVGFPPDLRPPPDS